MTSNPLSNQPSNSNLWQPNRTLSKRVEIGVRSLFALFAFVSVATTIGIVLTLIFETAEFFREVSIWRFLTETQWTPLFADKKFGVMVLVSDRSSIATGITSGDLLE
jgi:phosphate transport system permease protein